jgi:hypothetical protein
MVNLRSTNSLEDQDVHRAGLGYAPTPSGLYWESDREDRSSLGTLHLKRPLQLICQSVDQPQAERLCVFDIQSIW